MIVLLGFGGFLAFLTLGNIDSPLQLVTGTMGLVYISFAVVMIAVPQVQTFLAYQREMKRREDQRG